MDRTRRLAEFVVGQRPDALPPQVVDKAKQVILDHLGSGARAAFDADSTDSILAAATSTGSTGSATLIGESVTAAPRDAAFYNASLAHSLDFDDTHREGSVHPGAAVIPTALALAESHRTSGIDFVAAVVAGYEVTCRLAVASDPKAQYERGFHPTGTCGVFGATAAAARILGLSAAELEHAFGVNGSQASGSLQFFANGAWNKRIHPGLAAMNAMLAVDLARNGFRGATAAIDGEGGFLFSYGRPNPRALTHLLGRRHAVMQTALKPYPACRYAHAPLDAILHLVARHDLAADEIDSIEVGLSDPGVELIGRPVARKAAPRNVVDAQFSMPFLAAVAATKRRMTWPDYELIGDPAVMQFARHVAVSPDAQANRVFPRKWLARVAIRARGTSYSDTRWRSRGEPEAPLAWSEIEDKFRGLASPLFGTRTDEVIRLTRRLERLADTRELGQLLRTADRPAGRKARQRP